MYMHGTTCIVIMLWEEEPGLQENNHMGLTSFHATDALTPMRKTVSIMAELRRITLGSPKFERSTLHIMKV